MYELFVTLMCVSLDHKIKALSFHLQPSWLLTKVVLNKELTQRLLHFEAEKSWYTIFIGEIKQTNGPVFAAIKSIHRFFLSQLHAFCHLEDVTEILIQSPVKVEFVEEHQPRVLANVIFVKHFLKF
jgi:hypothetical protein